MKHHPEDKLYNRRLLAYAGLVFCFFWVTALLANDLILIWFDKDIGVAKVTAYLSVPGMLAGLGFWEYLKAAKKDDGK